MSEYMDILKTEVSRIHDVDFDNIPFGRVFSDHMFSADFIDGEWTNMKIIPFGNLSMHPATLALHYGQSIFEGMKASIDSEGRPLLFRPEMHARRLNASAKRMCMPEFPEDKFIDALNKLVWIDKNWIPPIEGSALYIRPIMFATGEYIGVAPSSTYKLLIFTLPVGPYYSKPVKLIAERTYVRAVKGGVGEAKTAGNYAASLLPALLAKEKGYDQVMWLDAKEFKYIQEVGTMNLFFVFKDKVVTPSADGAILKGITRDSIIKILRSWNVHVDIRPITIDELKDAYRNGELVEAFGSGTAAVIAHIDEIKDVDADMTFTDHHWELSSKLKKYLNNIRSGKIEDPFGWIVPVRNEVTV